MILYSSHVCDLKSNDLINIHNINKLLTATMHLINHKTINLKIFNSNV